MAENEQAQATEEAANVRFGVQRLYLRDSSFEAPNTPEIFREKYTPQVEFSMNTKTRKVVDDMYEVVLRLTAEAKSEDKKTYFLVEVQQAGVFEIKGVDNQQLEIILNTTCPNILFPYGREAIDALVVKGGFPALMLAPINFDAIYSQAKQNQESGQEAGAEAQPN